MAYAVKYLAGNYRAAGGNADPAVHYAAGHHDAAKRRHLIERSGKRVRSYARSIVPISLRGRQACNTGVNVASSSRFYDLQLDPYGRS